MKLKTTIALLCAITLISCNKNTDPTSVIGDWNEYQFCSVKNTGVYSCEDRDKDYTFNEDGTWDDYSGNLTSNAVWSQNGSELIISGTPCVIHWITPGKDWYFTWGEGDYERYFSQ